MALTTETKDILTPRFKTFRPVMTAGDDLTGVTLQVKLVSPETLPGTWSIEWIDRTIGKFRPVYPWDEAFGAIDTGKFYVVSTDNLISYGPFTWRRV